MEYADGTVFKYKTDDDCDLPDDQRFERFILTSFYMYSSNIRYYLAVSLKDGECWTRPMESQYAALDGLEQDSDWQK